MNSYTLLLTTVFLAGGLLGLFYFGGLWLTLRRINTTAHLGLLLAVSFACRTAVLLTAFFFVMEGEWERVAACLAGFLVTRFVMVRLIRPEKTVHNPSCGVPT